MVVKQVKAEKKNKTDASNPMPEITIRNPTDLGENEVKFVKESIEYLYEQAFLKIKIEIEGEEEEAIEKKASAASEKLQRSTAFVKALKRVLDTRFGAPEWAVGYGKDFGFATRFRKGSLGMFGVGTDHMVLVYRSPASGKIFLPPPHKDEAMKMKKKNTFSVLEKSENSDKMVEKVETILGNCASLDAQVLASNVRYYLVHPENRKKSSESKSTTASEEDNNDNDENCDDKDFTPYHVYAGSDYVAEVPHGAKNKVLALHGKTVKVTVFQHASPCENFLQSIVDNPSVLLPFLPYIVLLFYGMVFVYRRNGCGNLRQDDLYLLSSYEGWRDSICSEEGDNVMFLLGITLLLAFVMRKFVGRGRKSKVPAPRPKTA